MPKYLFQASYTSEGVKGLLKEGDTRRRQVIEDLTKGMGGYAGGLLLRLRR